MHPPARALSSSAPMEPTQSPRDDESSVPSHPTLQEEEQPVITAASDENSPTQEPPPLPPRHASAGLGESSSGISYFTEEFSDDRRIFLEGLRLRNPWVVKVNPRAGTSFVREIFPHWYDTGAPRTLEQHLRRVGRLDPRERIQEWLRNQPKDASYEPMRSYRDDQEEEEPVLPEDSEADVGLGETASGGRIVAEECSEADVCADPWTLEEQLRPVGMVDPHERVQDWLHSVTNPNEYFLPMDPFYGRWVEERRAIGAPGTVSYPLGRHVGRSLDARDGGDEVARGDGGEEGGGEDDGGENAAAGGH